MGSLRSCVLLLVMLVQFQAIVGKPLFFFDALCDYMCDDDDDVTTTASTSNEDDWDVFGLCACRPSRRNQGILPANINMRLPPSANGMNFSMSNNNGFWSFNLDAGPNGPPGSMGMLPAGPPAGAPAGPPTAAAGPTTPAVTTAASTTAKK